LRPKFAEQKLSPKIWSDLAEIREEANSKSYWSTEQLAVQPTARPLPAEIGPRGTTQLAALVETAAGGNGIKYRQHSDENASFFKKCIEYLRKRHAMYFSAFFESEEKGSCRIMKDLDSWRKPQCGNNSI
jgi:hypothetical protein